jgi:hypothetical protein
MPAEMPERARLLHYNRRRFFLNLFVFSSAAQKRYQSRMKVSRQGKKIPVHKKLQVDHDLRWQSLHRKHRAD